MVHHDGMTNHYQSFQGLYVLAKECWQPIFSKSLMMFTRFGCVYILWNPKTKLIKIPMGTNLQKRTSFDVPTENSLSQSLSFTALVSVQEQHLKSPSNNAIPFQTRKQDPEFEFVSDKPGSGATNPIKNSPADTSISNGPLLLQAFLSQSKHSQMIKHTSSKDRSTGRRSSSNRSSAIKASPGNPNLEVRNQANKEQTTASSWFGSRILQLFVSPCRESHALEPSVKGHTIPRNWINSTPSYISFYFLFLNYFRWPIII